MSEDLKKISEGALVKENLKTKQQLFYCKEMDFLINYFK
jgi:hypothetical protein